MSASDPVYAIIRAAIHDAILRGQLVMRWKAEPKDYDYVQSFQFDRAYSELTGSLQTKDYAEIVSVFSDNLTRLGLFAEMPLQLMFYSGLFERCLCEARFKRGYAPDDNRGDEEEGHRQSLKEILEKHISQDAEAYAQRGALYGADNLKVFLWPGHPGRAGVEAILAALITSAYSAFETLAGDLWICAVNRHPKLAKSFFDKNPTKNLDGRTLAGYEFDIKGHMGTILHDTDKVTFDSLSKIKSAYEHAFGHDICDAFEPAKDIYEVEKIRHLIAHRAGVIDQRFKNQMSDFAAYGNQMVGSRILLTGPIARDHISVCVKCGVNLVRTVDNWSVSHLAG